MSDQNNSPHDNPHWEEQRDERDVKRILEGKPVAANSNFKMTSAPNVYVLILKMIFSRENSFSIGTRARFVSALLLGLWVDFWALLFHRNQKSKPPDEPTDPDKFPF